ncbi:LysR family transcriptional regulator [Pseudomonas alliivorans]|nr:LysR family transcriptional regulator [Pseudomonas alliivorans]MEE4704697.1 LysR family transcriptional regulator [Pseudomonas alliivorans]MEE4775889.1 LysR family transcriptional regulator [Pseudomonas alliivorans]MEE5162325.1 LysR family transcriptional regulator [Pseudomonas alliivorans]
MPSIRCIEAFVKAVEGGSIASGARQLGVTAAAASQSIARLESDVGTRLLRRSTRSLALTDEGENYYARVRPLLRGLDEAHAEIGILRGEPQGRLKLACAVTFGRHVLAPWIREFMERYPKLKIELLLVDRPVDFQLENIDASIRYTQMLEPGLVARHIATAPIVYCASPAYLAKHGTPTSPEDLVLHKCLAYRMAIDGRVMSWPFLRNDERVEAVIQPSLVSSDVDALARICCEGGGIGRLGSFVAQPLIESGQLLQLFVEPSDASGVRAVSEPLEFFICYRDRQHLPSNVRLFIDEFSAAMSQYPGLTQVRRSASSAKG